MTRKPVIYYCQWASLALIWFMLIGIVYFLSNSLVQAYAHDDIPTATTVISCLAMIVYCTLVGVLTYVFVGLQRGRNK